MITPNSQTVTKYIYIKTQIFLLPVCIHPRVSTKQNFLHSDPQTRLHLSGASETLRNFRIIPREDESVGKHSNRLSQPVPRNRRRNGTELGMFWNSVCGVRGSGRYTNLAGAR